MKYLYDDSILLCYGLKYYKNSSRIELYRENKKLQKSYIIIKLKFIYQK